MARMISALQFVEQVVGKVRTPAIPYVLGGRSDKGTDCINLIGWCMDELGGRAVSRGSNTAWRADMDWTGTLAEAEKQKRLVPGALVFIDYGQGAMDHAGVFVGDGFGLITPDGKRGNVVHASNSRQGVYPSTLKNAWTHVAWLKGIDYGNSSAAVPNASDEVLVKPKEEQLSSEPSPGQAKVITTTSGLLLRKSPSASGVVIKEMPIGTIVTVLNRQGEWAQVRWDVAAGLWHIGWCRTTANGVDYLYFG